MADIFDEVDEDLKRDQMRVLWSRYGKILIVAMVAIILVVILRQSYITWQSSRSASSAMAFQEALKSENVISELEAKVTNFTGGYAMLAQFQIAAEYADGQNYGEAEAAYLKLAMDPDLELFYKQAATLLSVMVAPKEAKVDLLKDRLAGLEKASGPWQVLALEIGAGLSVRSGDLEEAVDKYKTLLAMNDVPAGMRQRAEQMIVILRDASGK